MELLVVIVVIAILAAITIVAYNGLQDRAKNVALLSAMDASEKALRMYAANNGSYPNPTDSDAAFTNMVCLGRGYQSMANFPNTASGRSSCYNYNGTIYAATSPQLDSALSAIASEPDVSGYIARGMPAGYAVRGILYSWTPPDASNPRGTATLEYVIGGPTAQPCGRGTANFTGTYTDCRLTLN